MTLFLSFLCLKSLFLTKKGLLFFDFFVRLSRTCVQHSGTAVQQCRMSVPHCRTKIAIRIYCFFLPTSLYSVAYSSSFSSRQQREKIASQCGKRDSATGAYIGDRSGCVCQAIEGLFIEQHIFPFPFHSFLRWKLVDLAHPFHRSRLLLAHISVVDLIIALRLDEVDLFLRAHQEIRMIGGIRPSCRK